MTIEDHFPPVRPQLAEARNPRRKKGAPPRAKKAAPKKVPKKAPRKRTKGAAPRPPKATPPGGSPAPKANAPAGTAAPAEPQLYDREFAGANPGYPPPAFLSVAAKGKWVEIVPVLLERKDGSAQALLDQVTRDSLAIFCDAWGQFDQACRILNDLESPFINVGNGALQAHPALALKKSAWAEIRNSAKLLGLNPISRRALKVTKSDGKKSAVERIVGD